MLLLASALLLSSCGSSTSSAPAVASEFIHAKAGSTFTFDEYSTDSMGMAVAGSQDTSVHTVLRTNGTIGSKTGLLVVEERKSNGKDTAYYSYETNNNVSLYFAGSSTPVFTLPVGTGVAVNTVTADTVVDQGNVSITRDTNIVALIGTETLTVKGQSVPTKKIQMTFHEVTTVNGSTFVDASSNSIINYAPSLGFIVQTTSPSRPDPLFGGWTEGSRHTLIDYYLK
jgi:hypothetical protein